ncbi:MAG: bifunctional UDP-N-acetylglucosamine diphosphorylase/glucosamine-1-phosphate N-acetyltransferase GlmU [Parvibaculaceae bacterium]|nr:bifunctional UDP-N-acetylglucosamine diphosphorylase/glucosamine-1-phosphate N-acetyltransferase GlmU [Parvibaculaceae bacterium]
MTEITAIVLAAGKGSRMKSAKPKVLHEIAHLAMLGHVLDVAGKLGAHRTVLVAAPAMTGVEAYARTRAHNLDVAIQTQPLGTADAVKAALPFVPGKGVVLILFGDTPLLREETLQALVRTCAEEADIAVLGFEAADPTGYGRLVLDWEERLTHIVEHKDAREDERGIRLCNGGAMAVKAEHLAALIGEVGNDNAAGEFYLPDIVAIAHKHDLKALVVRGLEEEVLGVNSRIDLAEAEAVFQRRARNKAMEEGVTLLDPQSVYFATDTRLGRDVVIGQNVVFGPGVTIADNVTIRPFSHIEGASVAAGAIVGPFARLRPGAEIGADAHIGNFVEIKKAVVETGAKINHLSYIGDARVGAGANIGAGTITCNYDGFNKHLTDIGAGAFIGSNSALVAPVKIGDGAYIGSGSVITRDVTPDALAVARGKQIERAGWASAFRAKNEKKGGE